MAGARSSVESTSSKAGIMGDLAEGLVHVSNRLAVPFHGKGDARRFQAAGAIKSLRGKAYCGSHPVSIAAAGAVKDAVIEIDLALSSVGSRAAAKTDTGASSGIRAPLRMKLATCTPGPATSRLARSAYPGTAKADHNRPGRPPKREQSSARPVSLAARTLTIFLQWPSAVVH